MRSATALATAVSSSPSSSSRAIAPSTVSSMSNSASSSSRSSAMSSALRIKSSSTRSSLALSALAFTPRFARAPVRPIRNPRRPPNTAPCGTARDAPARDHVAAHASRDDGAAAAGVDHRRVAGSRARVTARGAGTPVRIAGNDRPRVSHRARVVTPPASERPATQRVESIFSTNPRQRLPKSSVDCHSSAYPRGRRLRSSPACEARPPVTLEPLETATNRSRTSCVTPRLGWFTQCVAGQSRRPFSLF